MTPKLPDFVLPHIAQHMYAFHPYTVRRLAELYEKRTRLVYYTSAEVGLEILLKKKLWMRQVSCMNDYLEVQHGLQCLSAAYRGDHGKRLQAVLNGFFPGISTEIETKFDERQNELRYDTFIICLSEHAGPHRKDEDRVGRLSMWRAYGRGKGVALVFKQDPIWLQTEYLGIFSSPVAYLDDAALGEELGALATSLEAHADYVKSLGREGVQAAILHAFASAAVSTKHPGFKEEREWRVVRLPTVPMPCPFEKPTKVINGVPQEILVIDLKDDPAHGVRGLELPAVLDRVIIGPTEFPMPMYYAFRKAMAEAGIENFWEKLHSSYIPLRPTSQ